MRKELILKKRVNFPSKVKIGGHLYSVLYPFIFRQREDALAQCHYSQCVIRVQDTSDNIMRSVPKIKSSFLHELLHIIDRVYNGNRINDLENGEDIIIRLTSGLYQVVVDNNLYLHEPYKLPRIIKICGFKHKVIYPYDFKEDDNVYAMASHQTAELFIGRSNASSDSYIKCEFIKLILNVLDAQYIINPKDLDILENMAEGIYQVFKDNNIPNIIKNSKE